MYSVLQHVCIESSIYRRMHVLAVRQSRSSIFCAPRGPAFSDGPSEMDESELTREERGFIPSSSTARRVHPRQFSDIARKSAPLSGGAKAKHARERALGYIALSDAVLL